MDYRLVSWAERGMSFRLDGTGGIALRKTYMLYDDNVDGFFFSGAAFSVWPEEGKKWDGN